MKFDLMFCLQIANKRNQEWFVFDSKLLSSSSFLFLKINFKLKIKSDII